MDYAQLQPIGTHPDKTLLKKTPLEPAVILPENTPIEQEDSPPAVHSEPTTTVSLKAKLANLNLADIKPFYPRSEREQLREKQDFDERSLYADVASRKLSSLRPPHHEQMNHHHNHHHNAADRIIRMSERDLLEEQRRMREHGGVPDSFMDRSAACEPIPRRREHTLRVSPGRGYPRSYDELRSVSHRHSVHLPTSPLRPSNRPPSGMEMLEQNLERRGREPHFDRHSHGYLSGRNIGSAREHSEFDLWADYTHKKDRAVPHYVYSSRSAHPSLARPHSSQIERERFSSYYSLSEHSDYPQRAPLHTRRKSSRIAESSRFHPDTVDFDLYRYEDLCKSDPIYEDPTQDNEFFMYQMLAAEENAKREKRCGVATVIAPEQVAKATAPKKETQKSRICRHFLRGHCKFGESCNFFHGAPLVHASDQLIFLGGLPSGITSDMLIQELNRNYGVEVLNKPQIFSNFSPRVALSLDDAKLLKGHGKLNIFNRQVDVRPFEDNSKSEAEKCMVFLGGLPEGIKLTELISQLRKKGIQVMNKPYLGDGYARNVQVQSEKHANDLIRKRKIFLFSSSVDVRPYVNVYGKKKDEDNGTVIRTTDMETQFSVKATVTSSEAAVPKETEEVTEEETEQQN